MQASNILYLLTPQKLPLALNEINSKSAYTKEFSALQKLTIISIEQLASIQNNFINYLSHFERVDSDPFESQANKDNDDTFNIIRVSGETVDVLLASAVDSFLHLVNDYHAGGSSLSTKEWKMLCLAYRDIFNLYLNADDMLQWNLIDIVRPQNLSHAKLNGKLAYQRWVHGHYVFMIVIQAMIVNLNLFHTQIQAKQYEQKFLQSATTLMHAATISLKFAGDFSNEAYLEGVRPTLMPPLAKPNLSGLYWRDHEFLIKHTLKKTNDIFKNPHPLIAHAINEFKDAMAQAYDAHKYVCQKFVGTEETSLLTNKPAVEVLTIFKKSRLSYLSGDKK